MNMNNTTKMRFDRITQEESAIAVFLVEYAMKEIAKTLVVIVKNFAAASASNQTQKKGAGRK
ncbi:MAG: hypothetical protein JO297_16375 [Nitrososphaeraceae archaeon]|nr:hypothetical protein [Nitrososphaeraceae archaeon]